MEVIETILWRGLAFPGHESCGLFPRDKDWHLQGAAVFSHEEQPCRLSYDVVCDRRWHTRSARVEGWIKNNPIDIFIRTDEEGTWWLNEVEQPGVEGCTDIDLNFSPSTNLLPIRRLGLAVGEAAHVKAAWLRFPSFQLETLPQQYRRLNENTFRYESAGGQFVAELKVSRAGLVIEYPGIWQMEAHSTT